MSNAGEAKINLTQVRKDLWAKGLKQAYKEHRDHLVPAALNSALEAWEWGKQSPLQLLLVISVVTIGGVALTGLGAFGVFFVVATINAIVVSILISLSVAGGFLAFFFASVVAIYLVALSVAAFVVTSITILVIVASLVAAGWIGFFTVAWVATKKVPGLFSGFLKPDESSGSNQQPKYK